MKVLDVDSFRNGDHTTLKHGSVYEETMLGDSFVVFCPECGSPDCFTFNECDVSDSEIPDLGFFWADYRCKECGCEFRNRYYRKKKKKTVAQIFSILTIIFLIMGTASGLLSFAETIGKMLKITLGVSSLICFGLTGIFGIAWFVCSDRIKRK